MDDGSIVDLYLARDETAIAQTSEKYGAALRTLANRILDGELSLEESARTTRIWRHGTASRRMSRDYFSRFRL